MTAKIIVLRVENEQNAERIVHLPDKILGLRVLSVYDEGSTPPRQDWEREEEDEADEFVKVDPSQLYEGLRVRMTKSNEDSYYKGDIGTLTRGSAFHVGEDLVDSTGDYWANFPQRNPDHPRTCIGYNGFVPVLDEVSDEKV